MRVSNSTVARAISVGMMLAAAAAASAVPVTSWSYDGASLQHVRNDDGVFWAPYDATGNPDLVPDVTGDAFSNGMKLYSPNEAGRTFQVTGESYLPTPVDSVNGEPLRGNRLVMSGTATIDGALWDHPDDTIRTVFQFGFGFSGGAVDMYAIQTSFSLFDANNNGIGGVGSGTGLGVFEDAGGYGFGFNFVDRFGFDITSAVRIEWNVMFLFDWTNYGDTDTLDFFIPQNSVDIIAERIPAPSAAGLLAFAGIASTRRRR